MQERIKERAAQLRTEFEHGQKVLADLEQKRAELQQTVLRISGAILVLDELLAADMNTAAPEGEHAVTD